MSDHHGRIMNISATVPDEVLNGTGSLRIETSLAYQLGYRDARHAAAEIAIEADKLADILRRIIASADEPGSTDDIADGGRIVDARLIEEARELLK
jgi:hypothetical protein